ncbi:MAG: T9SS type A sorting domain-containing protein [Calditrichia bacterium]
MKKFSTVITLITTLLFASQLASGQIVINSSDFTPNFGDTYSNYEVSEGGLQAVNVGMAGGPQTWTFNETMYPNGTVFDFNIVDPATSPFSSEFPDANFAYSFVEDSINIDFFFSINPADIRYYGGGGSSLDTTFTLKLDPEEVLAAFPIQLGNGFASTHVMRFGIPGIFLSIDSSIVNGNYDAYGTMEIPAGSFDVIRIRRDVQEFTSVVVNGVPISSSMRTYIQYEWVTKEFGPLAIVTSQDNESNPNFTQAEFVNFRVNSLTGIGEDRERAVKGFQLNQNYPNPFNPTTEIAYELTRAMEAELTVYNVAGQAIATLASGLHTSGQHRVAFDAANLPAGIYFYRLSAGGSQQIKQMVLLK